MSNRTALYAINKFTLKTWIVYISKLIGFFIPV